MRGGHLTGDRTDREPEGLQRGNRKAHRLGIEKPTGSEL